jgi:hypothetical protein
MLNTQGCYRDCRQWWSARLERFWAMGKRNWTEEDKGPISFFILFCFLSGCVVGPMKPMRSAPHIAAYQARCQNERWGLGIFLAIALALWSTYHLRSLRAYYAYAMEPAWPIARSMADCACHIALPWSSIMMEKRNACPCRGRKVRRKATILVSNNLKPKFWLWLDRSVAFVFHCAVHTMCGWVCSSRTCLPNSSIPSTVRTSKRARPVPYLLLMLPVDKRYASVIHLWYDPNKLSDVTQRQTHGRDSCYLKLVWLN